MLISLEGNIGSGKSTLLRKLKSYYPEWIFLDEPVDTWKTVRDDSTGQDIISCFYGDQHKYAFSFQILAYITRLKLLLEAKKKYPDRILVTERSIDTDHYVFAQMLFNDGKISNLDWKIYSQYIQTFSTQSKIDAVVYVDTEPNTCLQRIHLRNREGESNIPLSYLSSCHDYHQNWLNNPTGTTYPVYRLDSTPDVSDEVYWQIQLTNIGRLVTDYNSINTTSTVSPPASSPRQIDERVPTLI